MAGRCATVSGSSRLYYPAADCVPQHGRGPGRDCGGGQVAWTAGRPDRVIALLRPAGSPALHRSASCTVHSSAPALPPVQAADRPVTHQAQWWAESPPLQASGGGLPPSSAAAPPAAPPRSARRGPPLAGRRWRDRGSMPLDGRHRRAGRPTGGLSGAVSAAGRCHRHCLLLPPLLPPSTVPAATTAAAAATACHVPPAGPSRSSARPAAAGGCWRSRPAGAGLGRGLLNPDAVRPRPGIFRAVRRRGGRRPAGRGRGRPWSGQPPPPIWTGAAVSQLQADLFQFLGVAAAGGKVCRWPLSMSTVRGLVRGTPQPVKAGGRLRQRRSFARNTCRNGAALAWAVGQLQFFVQKGPKEKSDPGEKVKRLELKAVCDSCLQKAR